VGRRGYPPEFRRKVLDLVEAAQNRSGSYMAGGYGELLQRVEADLARFAERVGVDLGRWRGPVLGDQEVAGFLRAVDAGIATLEPGGMCRLTGLSAMARRKPYQLFSTYEGGAANPGPVLTWSWRSCSPRSRSPPSWSWTMAGRVGRCCLKSTGWTLRLATRP
jgi:hypothetical protein